MSVALNRLASMAGDPLGPDVMGPNVPAALRELLQIKNGFYVFDGALHVFPSASPPRDLENWNASPLWRSAYGSLADSHFFFAEDVFGGQFSFRDDGIYSFDPETGESECLGATLNEWAQAILTDHAALVGSGISAAWVAEHGPMTPGCRLVPRQLFVLGGNYELSNLVEKDAVWSMRARGPIAEKIRDLPDGSQIVFTVD